METALDNGMKVYNHVLPISDQEQRHPLAYTKKHE
jgi:hypothetical protein